MSKHAEGPWEIVPEATGKGPEACYIFEGNAEPAELIATINYSNETTANARLISAAPELLAACKALAAAFGDFDAPGSGWHKMKGSGPLWAAVQDIEAAIYKAESNS